jgi:deazaflavin-dependent oxidoreductase (nitroreductase family)
MSSAPTTFEAGSPRISGPIRRLARHLGPIARPMAGRAGFPLYAVLHHTGRTSGKAYATPVVALRIPDGFIIPLPFGDATQWARNLFAAGGSLTWAGREFRIAEPRVIDRLEAGGRLPRLVRFLSARMGLRQFVLVRSDSDWSLSPGCQPGRSSGSPSAHPG